MPGQHHRAVGEVLTEGIVEISPPAWVALTDPRYQSNTLAWATLSDGRRFLVNGSDTGCSHMWTDFEGRPRQIFFRHDDWVLSVACAALPTGQLLIATGGKDRLVRIWGARSGRELHRIDAHGGSVNTVAWAVLPDGQVLLASGGDDATVRIWEGLTGRELHRMPVGPDHVCLVYSTSWAVLPTGQVRLAAINEHIDGGSSIYLWDGLTGTELRTWTVPDPGAGIMWGSVALTAEPDGRLLIAANPRATAHVWDATLGQPLYVASGAEARALAWARTRAGNLVLIAAGESRITVLEGYTGQVIATGEVRNNGRFCSLAVTSAPDGAILAAAAWERDIPARLWRIE